MSAKIKPAAIFPFDDRSVVFIEHLRTIAPVLEDLFSKVYISSFPSARAFQPEFFEWLDNHDVFQVINTPGSLPVGDHFRQLYTKASEEAPEDQVLHLCYIDRLAYALLTNEHRHQFIADIQNLDPADTPLIYYRTESAWETHPQNYREIEGLVTRTGEILFGRFLDYAWCHLAIKAGELRKIMSRVHNSDISMVAEMILVERNRYKIKSVDWLAWEDPFILACDANELKKMRENSPTETQKRLAYAIPMLELLQSASTNGNS